MSKVEIQGLTKTFSSGSNQIVAVDELDLHIDDGEFVTLVGPSGCGKSTTLRCLAGLHKPTSGKITIGDRDITMLPPQQRDVALIFQDIALYPHMSVRENIAYGLKIADVPKDERRERVDEAAEMLQITDQLDKSPADLSGGQQQRAALGRSLVRDPSIFLFDEPMSDLDAKLKQQLRPVIQQVTRKIGCPVLYVTHDQEEAMTMSDRIAIMNDGVIEQVGAPKNVYNEPESEFVHSFIGRPSTQFFDGKVVQKDGELLIETEPYEFSPEISPSQLNEYVDRNVRIGIRPQYIRVSEDPTGGIQARHKLDEPLGDETYSFFDTSLGEVVAVTPSDFEGNGDEYSVTLDPKNVKLFDPASGVRIA